MMNVTDRQRKSCYNVVLQMLSATVLVLVLLGTASCTTAIYGQPFNVESGHPDRYVLKVYIGGFAGGQTADNKAKAEIDKFMASHDYKCTKSSTALTVGFHPTLNMRFSFSKQHNPLMVHDYRH